MSNKNNSLSLLEQAQARTSLINDTLADAIRVHAGEQAIVVKKDSDGKDYLSATFKLKAPTAKVSEIVVNAIPVTTPFTSRPMDITMLPSKPSPDVALIT